jgi:hypothetical protein
MTGFYCTLQFAFFLFSSIRSASLSNDLADKASITKGNVKEDLQANDFLAKHKGKKCPGGWQRKF